MEQPSNGRTGKSRSYLIYAIGEIALVMIGILLALQVNNWNEERIQQEEEVIILKNLNSELALNQLLMNSDLQIIGELITGLETILEIMHHGPGELSIPEFERLLQVTVSTPQWVPSSFVLEELKNSGGFSRLKSDELKKLLYDWERSLANVNISKGSYKDFGRAYVNYLSDHGSLRNLDAMDGIFTSLKRSTIAKNELSLLKDPLFENRADNFYYLATTLRNSYLEADEIMKSIIDLTN